MEDRVVETEAYRRLEQSDLDWFTWNEKEAFYGELKGLAEEIGSARAKISSAPRGDKVRKMGARRGLYQSNQREEGRPPSPHRALKQTIALSTGQELN
jgi:hypothetical protein